MSDESQSAKETPTAATDTSGETKAEVTAPEVIPPAAAKPESKTEEKAPAAETKPEEQKSVVPEKYDIKLPDGSLVDPKRVESIASLAKERGLTNEQAQGLLTSEHEAVASFASRQQEAFKARSDEWMGLIKNDPEIGGEKFKENAEFSKRAVDRFGSPEFKKILDETGLGNHPELVRAWVRIGRAMKDDSFVKSGQQGGGREASPADILYPKKKD